VEAQLELARRLHSSQGRRQLSPENLTLRLARHREKLNEVELMQKVAAEKARAKGDPVIAYRWLYDNYRLDIEHVGECGNRVPKYDDDVLAGRGRKNGICLTISIKQTTKTSRHGLMPGRRSAAGTSLLPKL
jgi:hypothetical protein